MKRRIPIENDDPAAGRGDPSGEELEAPPPSKEAVRKAYGIEEEFPPVSPPSVPPEEAEGAEEGPQERLLRLAAEFENYKKRIERERASAVSYANETLLERLLPVVDNLERALAAAEPKGGQDGLVAGVEITLRELLEVLRREGVEPIVAEGEPFDPTVHEAVMTQPSSDVPEGDVLLQIEKGYRYRDRILRPAKVVVSSGPAGAKS